MRTSSSSAILMGDKQTTEDHNVNKKSRKQNEESEFCLPPVKACAPNGRRQRRLKNSSATDDREVVPNKKRKTAIAHKHPTKKQKVEKKGRKTADCLCVICCEKERPWNMFTGSKCHHDSYCKDCISKHVTTKVEENIIRVKCPDPECDEIIEPETCRFIVPLDSLDQWEFALCKSLIPDSERFYCPYENCSVLLIKDEGNRLMRTECPHCIKWFCAECKVPWHEKLTCKKFQEMMKSMKDRQSDDYLAKLAEEMKWKKCPCCGFYVQRISGCNYMLCRCGCAFCYGCGIRFSKSQHHPHLC